MRSVIEAHLKEHDFGVERLAEKVGLGPRHLSWTLRLERAAQLLGQ